MRRLGALLIILGANLVVGSIAVAFYLSVFHCALSAPDGQCGESYGTLFVDALTSGPSVIVWVVVVAGVFSIWKGRQLRAREAE